MCDIGIGRRAGFVSLLAAAKRQALPVPFRLPVTTCVNWQKVFEFWLTSYPGGTCFG
jgi:hypothetical protein